MNWIKIEDRMPPYDTRVIVRGKGQYGYDYAVAYNEAYGTLCMTQLFSLDEKLRDKLPTYVGVPFKIEEWMELE